MPKLVPDHHVRVGRGGKNIDVKPGQAFDFTKDEVEQILRARPDSLRSPVDESAALNTKDDSAALNTKDEQKQSTEPAAQKQDQKKAATKADSDL